MKNLTLINDALLLIGAIPEGIDASAEQSDLALREAGQLVDDWADDGFIVNWDPNATAQDDCTAIGQELTALKYALALRLCPHFGRDPSASLIGLADGAISRMKRKQMVTGMPTIEASMPAQEAGVAVWDITQG